jgi:methionyl aminopeptidase
MSVTIKTPEEIEKMRIAGRLGSEVLDYITPFVKPGSRQPSWTSSAMTTW